MALGCGSNYLDVDKSLIWITPIPNMYSSRTSPVFSLMGSEWCFLFEFCVSGGIAYHWMSLNQMKDGKISQETKTLKPEFNVRTYMMDITNNGDSEFLSTRTCIDIASKRIWYSEKEAIYKELPWLYRCPEVKFICKFYGQHSSKFQLQIEKESPVVLNKPPPTTDDKSVQVSPGVPLDVGVQVSSQVPRDIESLSSDFSHLLEKEILPDMVLKCGDRMFRAHRSVLAARSDVFRAMFQNEMLESKTGDVRVSDLEVGVLENLLRFVYTGRSDDLSEDCTSDLYEAADKYAVLSLKEACSYWIKRNLTVQNCVKYLKVADSHSDCDLKTAVISFIVENSDVLKSSEWLLLSKELPVLAVEVYQTHIASTDQ